MTTEDLYKLTQDAQAVYAKINKVCSRCDTEMLDLLFPNHDGKEDALAGCEMLRLRDAAFSLSNACEMLMDKLTLVLDTPDYNGDAHEN